MQSYRLSTGRGCELRPHPLPLQSAPVRERAIHRASGSFSWTWDNHARHPPQRSDRKTWRPGRAASGEVFAFRAEKHRSRPTCGCGPGMVRGVRCMVWVLRESDLDSYCIRRGTSCPIFLTTWSCLLLAFGDRWTEHGASRPPTKSALDQVMRSGNVLLLFSEGLTPVLAATNRTRTKHGGGRPSLTRGKSSSKYCKGALQTFLKNPQSCSIMFHQSVPYKCHTKGSTSMCSVVTSPCHTSLGAGP